MPPDQKASQTRSILLFSSPVITDGTLVTGEGPGVDMADLLRPGVSGAAEQTLRDDRQTGFCQDHGGHSKAHGALVE